MLHLPAVPYSSNRKTAAYNVARRKADLLQMRGINYGDNVQSGDMADSLNISARRWPFITTRKGDRVARESGDYFYSWAKDDGSARKIVAATASDSVIWVEERTDENGTKAYVRYKGQDRGEVTAGVANRQLVKINTKLVIWPDKVYLDLTDNAVHPLGASNVTFEDVVFDENSDGVCIVTAEAAYWQDIKAGDTVKFGWTGNNKTNISAVVKALGEEDAQGKITATFSANLFPKRTAKNTDHGVTLTRSVPDMEYICEAGNRLWGCNSKKQCIYGSALGDPTNFNTFEGVSTDSYTVSVGSDGIFTGCCKLGSSVLFWKKNTLHKLLGSYPAEFSLYDYTVDGLREGCHKSLVVINETLYYMSIHGVCAFTGRTPQLISANFGERNFNYAIGGSDGDSYYLSVKEGDKTHLFVYETRLGIWVRENDFYCTDFFNLGMKMFYLHDGTVYACGDGDLVGDDSTYTLVDEDGEQRLEGDGHTVQDMPWLVQFKPFTETIEGRKVHSRLVLRAELPEGSRMAVSVRYDGAVWIKVKTYTEPLTRAVPIALPLQRCDKFDVKLEGEGPCAIEGIMREFTVGSEV